MLVCLYEDRPQQIPGVKLLILSLTKHCPTWSIWLTCPAADECFRTWLLRYPQVCLMERQLEESGSFNVKPTVLLTALKEGVEECVWIDTDIIVNGQLDPLLAESAEAVVVTQDPWEYASGSSHRASTWGLEVGRDLPGPLNSALVRVTYHHIELLEAWQSFVRRRAYLEEQSKPTYLRNNHLLGDQDLLSALLASQEFSKFTVRRLKHGKEILQHHGAGAYGVRLRWITLTEGLPPLIHAMGTTKPWQMPSRPALMQDFRSYYERVYLELSPYVHVARQYQSELGEACEWMNIHTAAGRVSTMMSLNHPSLKGTTQALLHRASRSLPRRLFSGKVWNK